MARIAPYAFFQELDDNGAVLDGGLLYTYEAGTTTPKTTYTDLNEVTANANPVVLDASGRADVWLGTGAYKFVLKTSADVLVKEVDNIVGEASNVFGATVTNIAVNTSITDVFKNGIVNCTAALTLSLLDVATAEEGFLFTVKNSSSGQVTIDPDASETINGSATFVLEAGESILVICNGVSWLTTFELPDDLIADTVDVNTITTDKLLTPDDGELTISSGAITATGVTHRVDTESDASTDDLDTINGGADGQLLILYAENASRVVTLTTAGNISIPASIELTSVTVPIILQYNGASSKWVQIGATAAQGALADTAVQPAELAATFVLGTEVATTSGTAFDFTGIPTGTKRITISFVGVSLSGTDDLLVQLGDSGGIETTGYISSSGVIRNATTAVVSSSTSGFFIQTSTATSLASGQMVLIRVDSGGLKWSESHSIKMLTTQTATGGGDKTLSAELTQLRITRNGTDTFDAGSINIQYEV